MVGADVLGRPPPTGTTPLDDTSTRAAEDVGPYQHHVHGRATCMVGPHTVGPHMVEPHTVGPYMVGADVLGRPPHAGTTPVDDTSTRAAGTSAPTNTTHSWRAQGHTRSGRTHGRGGRPRPPAPSPPAPRKDNAGARRTRLPMRDLFARLATEGKDMRPLPWRSTQTTCHGVPDNIRPFLDIMGLIPYARIKEPALKTKVPRLRQKRLEVANRSGQPTHAREWTGSTIPDNARLFRSFVGHMHQHVEMIRHDQAERHEPLTRHMVMPHGLQDHRRVFHKIRHAARPGADCHEEERSRRAIRRAVIEAFTNRQVVHAFQCSTNEIPAQRRTTPAQRPPPQQ